MIANGRFTYDDSVAIVRDMAFMNVIDGSREQAITQRIAHVRAEIAGLLSRDDLHSLAGLQPSRNSLRPLWPET